MWKASCTKSQSNLCFEWSCKLNDLAIRSIYVRQYRPNFWYWPEIRKIFNIISVRFGLCHKYEDHFDSLEYIE